MDGQQAQYIPFATGLYLETNMWSWKPYRKETLYGRIIFSGAHRYSYGFRDPNWIIDQYGILDGLLFYKLLKQILYFPNCVVSLPSILYDNSLFILYLKYMMTRFEDRKLFCLNLRNMETEVAQHYGMKDGVVVLNEHRCFSVVVIQNGQRVLKREMMRKYMAMKSRTDYVVADPEASRRLEKPVCCVVMMVTTSSASDFRKLRSKVRK